VLRLCKQCQQHFGDEGRCPHCGTAARDPLGRAVKVTAAAISAAAFLSACPAYGHPVIHCVKEADCAANETCDAQTQTCELKTDAGP